MATKKPLGQGCVAVADPGEGPGPPLPLFLDQTEKIWGGGRAGPPPLFQGLDLALCCFGGRKQSGRTFHAFRD